VIPTSGSGDLALWGAFLWSVISTFVALWNRAAISSLRADLAQKEIDRLIWTAKHEQEREDAYEEKFMPRWACDLKMRKGGEAND
jgi:hypothetical protein